MLPGAASSSGNLLETVGERGREFAEVVGERVSPLLDAALERGAEFAEVARERGAEFAEVFLRQRTHIALRLYQGRQQRALVSSIDLTRRRPIDRTRASARLTRTARPFH